MTTNLLNFTTGNRLLGVPNISLLIETFLLTQLNETLLNCINSFNVILVDTDNILEINSITDNNDNKINNEQFTNIIIECLGTYKKFFTKLNIKTETNFHAVWISIEKKNEENIWRNTKY